MAKSIGIVGAGIGGLASAARLAYRGHKVEVFEKLDGCGGRCNIIEDKGFKFDTGPSFVLMPDFFEELFSYCGCDINDHLRLVPLETSYKIFYADGQALTIFQDSRRTREELEKIEKGAASAFDRFMERSGRIYDTVKPMLYRCFTPSTLLNPVYWLLLNRLSAMESYWNFVRRIFKNDKLSNAFTFESMFIGVSPFDAPALYSIITYLDHAKKIHHPMGGMYQIPLALEKLCRKMGVKFHYRTPIDSIRQNRTMLRLCFGKEEFEAAKTVVNADYAYAQSALLGRRIPRYDYSCSAYLIYLGLKKKVKGLEHHNIFFSADLAKNLRDIFRNKTALDDPSFYVHVPTHTDASLAPEGKDILYILVPVSNLDRQQAELYDYEQAIRGRIFERIKQVCGLNLEDLIEVEHRFYPHDFVKRYNLKFGAAFGLSHTLMQSAFFRPPNIDLPDFGLQIPNLYYVGASTQPGGGLPVVIAGSRIVANFISRDKRGGLRVNR